MIGTAYLVGSGEPRTMEAVMRRVRAELGKEKLRVAACFSAMARVGRNHFLERSAGVAFAKDHFDRFGVLGDGYGMSNEEAERVVAGADLVFMSGGDPVAGARLLDAAGAGAWLSKARARGAALLGISAGAIMLGAYWAEWDDLGKSRAVRCTGAVPDLVVDCHDEASDWEELREAKVLLAQEANLRFVGIPAGGAILVDGEGRITAEGRPFFAL